MKQKTAEILLVTFFIGILISQTACKACKCPAYSYQSDEQQEQEATFSTSEQTPKQKIADLVQDKNQAGKFTKPTRSSSQKHAAQHIDTYALPSLANQKTAIFLQTFSAPFALLL